MRIASILLSFTLLVFAGHASPSFETLSYRHGDAGFEMRLTPRDFVLRDRDGIRTIERKTCNRAVLEKYWSEISRHVGQLRPRREVANAGRLTRATLVADGRAHDLSLFDEQLRYFDRVVPSSHGLFIDELRACRGHK